MKNWLEKGTKYLHKNIYLPISSKKLVAIVIPIYKNLDALTKYERISLIQCRRILHRHPFVLAAPRGMDVSSYVQFFEGVQLEIEFFEAAYFESISGYNDLMLSTGFYKRFLMYRYILVLQLDVFIFKDELKYWCQQRYDYIGAPWLTNRFDYEKVDSPANLHNQNVWEIAYRENHLIDGTMIPKEEQFYNRVGNGGFSLRNTARFVDIITKMSPEIDYYKANKAHHFFNEDAFWSLEVNRKSPQLKIPSFREAVFFSIEFIPEKAFVLTRNQLPFGCHDWDNNLEFWEARIRAFNHEL